MERKAKKKAHLDIRDVIPRFPLEPRDRRYPKHARRVLIGQVHNLIRLADAEGQVNCCRRIVSLDDGGCDGSLELERREDIYRRL
jgi:hypothetical protein